MSTRQHGFRHGRSCLTNLLNFHEQWARALDRKSGVDVLLYFDFRKAFDCVPHLRLLQKLDQQGIAGRLHSWIQSFLTKRTLRVNVGEGYSKFIDVTSEVPQGSVLGGIVDETLKPNRQCTKAAKNANSIMRAIKASFIDITLALFHKLKGAFIRPTWNTHSKPGDSD